MAEASGTKLGHYRLVAPIGTGGFATVYRAVDERLDADVAVKVLAENHALDIDVRERFITEAQLLRRLCDPSVVTVYDIGETERGQPFIVLGHADRGDLRSRVMELRGAGRRPSQADLLVVAETLAAALGRVHEAGLVHRDVTPDNLLITSTGRTGEAASGLLAGDERLQLGDLGLAKDLMASSGFTVGAGTHGFSAPEQRSGMSRVDARADVYGASAVMFWLVAGTTPADDVPSRTRALAEAGIPRPMAGAVAQGLATNPADRFETIADWYRRLTEGCHPEQLETSSDGPDEAPPPAAPRARARRWLTPAIVAIVALVAIGGTWWALGERAKPSVTRLADGRVKVERRAGDLQGAVFGPATASVGQRLTFEAAAAGAVSLRWVAPDGQLHEGNSLVVNAMRPGSGRVSLLVSDGQGRSTTVEFPFEVLDVVEVKE